MASGAKRIVNGEIAQSKVRGKALVTALGAFTNEQNAGAKGTKVAKKKK